MLAIFLGFNSALSDYDRLVSQELVDSINNDSRSTFKAKLYPKFSQMTVHDAKKFLSPIRKSPAIHASARPVGYSERSFYNSDKRMFTGIGKEIICDPQQTDDYMSWRQFSDEIREQPSFNSTGKAYPKSQFSCKSNTNNSIRYYVQYELKENIAQIPFTVYDNTIYCSSWATAVTSAMSTTLSRWSGKSINLSIQFLLDCDILGDPCIERPPLSAYEQFWRRYIPQSGGWRSDGDPLSAPSRQLTQQMCNNYRSCYPGQSSCKRELVLTGVCEPGAQQYGACPIYFLYNWRWIKSHLAEVGAVTSSILARADLFTYSGGVYSSWGTSASSGWGTEAATPDISSNEDKRSAILGMLDVTIIGWGQTQVNLSSYSNQNTQMRKRWWYVIPHLGINYGMQCSELMENMAKVNESTDVDDGYQTFGKTTNVSWKHINQQGTIDKETINGFKFILSGNVGCSYNGQYEGNDTEKRTGVIKFNRRFDDSNIESQAVGAVPYNFIPMPWRTPSATWRSYAIPLQGGP